MEQCTSGGVQNRLRRDFALHHVLAVTLPPQIRHQGQILDLVFWWALSVLHQSRSCFGSRNIYVHVSRRRSSSASRWGSSLSCRQESRYDHSTKNTAKCIRNIGFIYLNLTSLQFATFLQAWIFMNCLISHKGIDGGTMTMFRLSLSLSREGYGVHRCNLAIG